VDQCCDNWLIQDLRFVYTVSFSGVVISVNFGVDLNKCKAIKIGIIVSKCHVYWIGGSGLL